MPEPIRLRVFGDYALFSRPELKVERYSYDVMTPSAARGILDAIYYHPGLRWCVKRIIVERPIRFTNIRRNEVSKRYLPQICLPPQTDPKSPFSSTAATQ